MSGLATIETEDWVAKPLPVPGHWSLVNFDEVFSLVSTNKIKTPEKEYQYRGVFPIVDQGRNLIGGYTDVEDSVINRDGSVIVFGDHTRCFKLIPFPFVPGADGTKVLRPHTEVLPKFAYYGCLTLALPNRGYSRHYSFLRSSKFPVAPLAEQRRIVAKIEELFSELDNGVEALTTAREQLKVYRKTLLDQAASGDLLVARGVQRSRFNEDAWRSLSEVVSSLGQGWSPRCLNHPASSEELWAVITTTAIQHSSFDDQENKQLPDELEPRTHLVIQPGDILVTRAGPRKRVGVACLVRRSRSRLMVCDKAYRLRVKEKELLPEWMELILNSPRILQSVEELKTGISDSGVNLTQDRFLGLRVPVPSLKAQRETLSIVDAATSHATNLAGQIDSALIQIDALRHSILKQAFSGQLVAQDPTDEPASVLLERIRAERKKADAKKPGRKTKITGNSKTGKRATA
jgi:hypothetical protein